MLSMHSKLQMAVALHHITFAFRVSLSFMSNTFRRSGNFIYTSSIESITWSGRNATCRCRFSLIDDVLKWAELP